MLLALALVVPTFAFPLAPAAQETPRGWLGVGLAVDEGRERPLSVAGVNDGSPAERAGLQAGDRLVALDGRPIASYDALIQRLREYGPGRDVRLTVRRALSVELDGRGWGEAGGPRLGVHLGQIDDGDGARWVARQAEPGWPAARAGVQAGDRIVAVAGRRPTSFDELQAVLAEVAPERVLELEIERDLELRLGAGPEAQPSPLGGRLVLGGRAAPTQLPRSLERGEGPPSRSTPGDGAPELERRLQQEIAGLNQELRALREELRTLRRELASLRGN